MNTYKIHPARRLLAGIVATCFSGLATITHAQLVIWDFSSSTSPASPATGAANLGASSVAWSDDVSGTYGIAWQAGGQAYARFDALDTAFNEAKYLSFTVTADEGYLLNLSSLTFSFGGNNTHTSVVRTAYASVRTDAETIPFSTDLTIAPAGATTASVAIPANTTTSSIVYETLGIDLTGAEYQGVSAITIRIYGYASASATNANWRIGDITLDGTVTAVPEPSRFALLAGGAALVSMVCLRRLAVRSIDRIPKPALMNLLRAVLATCLLPAVCASAQKTGRVEEIPGSQAAVYRQVGEAVLRLHVFLPPGHRASDRRPAMLIFFGGSWERGDPTQFARHATWFASRGMVVGEPATPPPFQHKIPAAPAL
jgi:hypothetical protein